MSYTTWPRTTAAPHGYQPPQRGRRETPHTNCCPGHTHACVMRQHVTRYHCAKVTLCNRWQPAGPHPKKLPPTSPVWSWVPGASSVSVCFHTCPQQPPWMVSSPSSTVSRGTPARCCVRSRHAHAVHVGIIHGAPAAVPQAGCPGARTPPSAPAPVSRAQVPFGPCLTDA